MVHSKLLTWTSQNVWPDIMTHIVHWLHCLQKGKNQIKTVVDSEQALIPEIVFSPYLAKKKDLRKKNKKLYYSFCGPFIRSTCLNP